MEDPITTRRNPHPRRREPPLRRRSWCCSFTDPPRSPENSAISRPKPAKKTQMPSKPHAVSTFPISPQSTRLGLVGRMDRRRILSPGRVSPIDSDAAGDCIPEIVVSEPSPMATASRHSRSEVSEKLPATDLPASSSNGAKEDENLGMFDVRLNLKGKDGGGSLVLELNSEVLSSNSSVFSGLIADYWKGSSGSASKLCRIEVPDLENLNVFRETIELMFEEDIANRLLKVGVHRSIDILEVSAGIMFTRGVLSCLTYLEAVPWSEEEEEKLRCLFNRFKFDDSTTRDILARLYSSEAVNSQQNLARKLVWSITGSSDANARNELKSLVKGLLCKSSVYEKEYPDLNKDDLYVVCLSCIDSLISLFQEASGTNPHEKSAKTEIERPLIERISRQVDNINFVLEILLDRQMVEEFVIMWADQEELLRLHESASPMLRYELSRVSAMLFIAIGTRKLHCRSESRLGLLRAWFKPMLFDFGWLQRCRKGLEMRVLEEAMGQALLTLPLKQQHVLFMEWFRWFSKHGTECPNLGKAFQIWWRRSFLRGSESYAVESR